MKDHNGNDEAAGHDESTDAIGSMIREAGLRPTIDPERRARVEQRLRAEWRAGLGAQPQRRRRWMVGVAVAAVLSLVAFGLWRSIVQPTLPPAARLVVAHGRVLGADHAPLASGAALLPGTPVESASDGGAAFEMSSGVVVRMAGDTAVEVLDERQVRLERGRVYIDTGLAASPAHSRQISVLTPFGTVEDIGTQFELLLDAATIRVRVREGRVRVGEAASARDVEHGAQLILAVGAAPEMSAIEPTSQEWDWSLALAQPFKLEGATLARFLEWSTRESGLRLSYADPTAFNLAESTVLHGSIEQLHPRAAIDAVIATTTLRISEREGEIHVSRSAQ